MKRKITFSLTLTLSLLLSLVSLPSTAQAAPQRFRADLGLVTLSATEVLRVTVTGPENETIRVRLRWMQYGAPVCSGMPAVCRYTVTSQGTTPVQTLGTNDAISLNFEEMRVVRVMVDSNSANARVKGSVFDHSTQRITAFFDTEMLQLD